MVLRTGGLRPWVGEDERLTFRSCENATSMPEVEFIWGWLRAGRGGGSTADCVGAKEAAGGVA
eukprot:260142-Rhodomonas_salina.7